MTMIATSLRRQSFFRHSRLRLHETWWAFGEIRPRATIPSGSRDALYADMKLGATPGFVGISLPVNGHETRSLLAESPARQFDLASARLDAICRRAGSGQADYPGLAEAPNGGRLGLNQQPSGGCRLITDRSQQSAYLAMDLLGESGALPA
jgi:hypothetical protein